MIWFINVGVPTLLLLTIAGLWIVILPALRDILKNSHTIGK